jgi:hypothetical protein
VSTVTDIRAAIASALAGIDGSAPYAVDVSARVVYGLEGQPHTGGACVRYRLGAHERERADAAYGAWVHTVDVQVEGHIGGGAQDLGSSEDAAQALGVDIVTALTADPTLGGLVEDCTRISTQPDGPGVDAMTGGWVVSVSASYRWTSQGAS